MGRFGQTDDVSEVVESEVVEQAPEQQATEIPSLREGEIDLWQILASIWRGKWLVIACMVVSTPVGLYRLTGFTPIYTARMVVLPTSDAQSQGFGNSGSPTSSNIQSAIFGGKRNSFTFQQLKVIIGSIRNSEQLDKKYNLLKTVYKSSWDADIQQWRPPPRTWKSNLKDILREFIPIAAWIPPGNHELAKFIKESILINDLRGTGFVKLEFMHSDPQFARDFLQRVFDEADSILREGERRLATQRLAYLRKRIDETTIQDYRLALTNLLSGIEKRSMLLDSDEPFAAKIVDPVTVSNRPSSPNIVLTVAVSMLAGLGIGILFVLLFDAVRNRRSHAH